MPVGKTNIPLYISEKMTHLNKQAEVVNCVLVNKTQKIMLKIQKY